MAAPIQLKFDGSPVSPPPTISSSGGLTNVSYPSSAASLLAGPHVYTLTYADNLGGFYTNEVVFNVTFQTLPPSYALPGAGVTRGFTYRTVSASSQVETNIPSTVARAEAQLAGTLINTATGLAYTNEATPGTNAGYFNIDTVLNFSDGGFDAGNFPGDTDFPGLDFPPYNWFSTEALLFLDLPPGYYRFGVNSDDGFEVKALPPQGVPGAPIVLGIFDNGRVASDTLFDFLVQTSGVYIFQVIYFESTGSASEEFFSVTNLTTGDKALINDVSNPSAIKSYRVLKPRITSIVRNGANAAVSWAYGTPPFQVQFKTNVNDTAWNNVGSPTSNHSANVPIQTATGFIRVAGSP